MCKVNDMIKIYVNLSYGHVVYKVVKKDKEHIYIKFRRHLLQFLSNEP